MSDYKRILAMDGGPASGTYVQVLARLRDRQPGLLLRTDLFAGTSAGAFAAAFLAHNLKRNATLEDEERVVSRLLDVTAELLHAMMPTRDGYRRLVAGEDAMVPVGPLKALLERDDVLGRNTRLGDLDWGVVLVAARMLPPWTPHLMSNVGPTPDMNLRLVDAVLRSTAFPVLLPGWQGYTDGAMYANSPSAVAIIEHYGGRVPDDVMLLSLGADDGSSTVSNLWTPADGEGVNDPDVHSLRRFVTKTGQSLFEAVTDKVADVLGMDQELELDERVKAAIQQVVRTAPADKAAAVANWLYPAAMRAEEIQQRIHQSWTREFEWAAELFQPPESTALDDWGWKAWALYPNNPVFGLQVFLNSQGRGTHHLSTRLLGEGNALRIAPVAFVSSNSVFLCMIFALADEALAAGRDTANLWADPVMNEVLKFDVSLAEADAFCAKWLTSPAASAG